MPEYGPKIYRFFVHLPENAGTLNRVKMVRHSFGSRAGISALQGFQDRRMLVHEADVLRAVQHLDEDGTDHELLQVCFQQAIAGKIGKDQVEVAGQPDRTRLFQPVGALLLGYEAAQRCEIRFRTLRPDDANEHAFDAVAGLEYFARFTRRRFGDEGSVVRLVLDDQLRGEQAQHFPKTGPADVENIGQNILVQLRARLQPALDDCPYQLALRELLGFKTAPFWGRRSPDWCAFLCGFFYAFESVTSVLWPVSIPALRVPNR